MKKLLIFLFGFSATLHAQEAVTPTFETITNADEAQLFLDSNPSRSNTFIVFNEENHKTELARNLFSSGQTTVDGHLERTRYKVVDRFTTTHYRANYIFIDGNKIDAEAAESLIKTISKKYKDGVPFSKLAQQYSMDRNANRNGDTGWFAPGKMHPELERVIINVPISKRDLFSFELKDKSWYYLVLNSYQPKEIKEIKVLKIVEKK
ncbi:MULTISPECIES: peptidylprolyl isomerase [Bizionia]|uniref:PpiC domain-containing protein n=1 Tax=Bizionia algoritergicola TaxID=291187 RepID=A0A5D0QX19_9FLAO|nr:MULTISPECIES: peptidylprolyl isomerase [Bizionia]OBX21473.1 hypothetical protein BAA08_12600 [Bizionia sp. APA-3]TYB73722.1 hypothetical protein ES675_08715 [Bizionia algoritergicola]